MQQNIIKITDRIEIFLSQITPVLSADIGIIRGDTGIYLYDIGASEEACAHILKLEDKKTVLLSHFHPDHIGNIRKLPPECYVKIMGSRESLRHIPQEFREKEKEWEVKERICWKDGIQFETGILPSSHAKGSLYLTINQEYTFLGDATYSKMIKGAVGYNRQILQNELCILRDMKTKYFILSHKRKLVYDKNLILKYLERILKYGNPKEPFISIQP